VKFLTNGFVLHIYVICDQIHYPVSKFVFRRTVNTSLTGLACFEVDICMFKRLFQDFKKANNFNEQNVKSVFT